MQSDQMQPITGMIQSFTKITTYFCIDSNIYPVRACVTSNDIDTKTSLIEKYPSLNFENSVRIELDNINYMITEEIFVANDFMKWIPVLPAVEHFKYIRGCNTEKYYLLVNVNNYTIHDFELKKLHDVSIGTYIEIAYTFNPQELNIITKNMFKYEKKKIAVDDNIINGYSKFLEITKSYQQKYCTDLVKYTI